MLKKFIGSMTGIVLFGLAASATAGGSVDVALTNESVRAEHGAVRTGTAAYLTVGGWYHLDDGQMLNAGFHAIDPNNTRPELVAGLGGKSYLFKVPGQDTSVTIGLGGFARYHPEQFNGFGGEVSGYYSPQVLAFGRLEQFFDIQARLTYEVLPQGRIFVGYSHMEADYDEDVVTLDSSVTLGFRIRY